MTVDLHGRNKDGFGAYPPSMKGGGDQSADYDPEDWRGTFGVNNRCFHWLAGLTDDEIYEYWTGLNDGDYVPAEAARVMAKTVLERIHEAEDAWHCNTMKAFARFMKESSGFWIY